MCVLYRAIIPTLFSKHTSYLNGFKAFSRIPEHADFRTWEVRGSFELEILSNSQCVNGENHVWAFVQLNWLHFGRNIKYIHVTSIALLSARSSLLQC